MSWRRSLAGAGMVSGVLIAGGAAFAVRYAGDGDTAGGDTPSTAPSATAEVTRKTLAEHEDFAGTLGYGDTTDVSLGAEGILTALPGLGTTIDRGQTVVEVNGRAIPLFFGDRPLWRTLDANATDGVDIQELEENLVALGYASSSTLTVDQDWTAATTTAVKRWQKATGRDQTGTVAPGDVVILPGVVRVSAWPTSIGGQAGGPVLTVTGTTRQVTVDLDTTKQTLVSEGQAVEVELPDGSTTPGTIASVGTTATAGTDDNDDGQPDSYTIEVVVTLDDPAAGGSYDEAPVTVAVTTSAAEDVLAVPVDALLATADGSYIAEKVGSGGTTTQVPVETGAFADGWVEVTGDLAKGDDVVVPK